MRPLSNRVRKCKPYNNVLALAGWKRRIGSESSSAASIVKVMAQSETRQVTGGTSQAVAEWLSLERRSRNGGSNFSLIDSQRETTWWVASRLSSLLGGTPSRMLSKQKKSSRALRPLDLSKSLWLCSVWTKVMWKPLRWSSFASLNNGLIWPCMGNGENTACGFLSAEKLIFDFLCAC